MATDDALKRALDHVDYCRNKVDRRWRKNPKILAFWNLWAAEDKAQHLGEALQNGTVVDI